MEYFIAPRDTVCANLDCRRIISRGEPVYHIIKVTDVGRFNLLVCHACNSEAERQEQEMADALKWWRKWR